MRTCSSSTASPRCATTMAQRATTRAPGGSPARCCARRPTRRARRPRGRAARRMDRVDAPRRRPLLSAHGGRRGGAGRPRACVARPRGARLLLGRPARDAARAGRRGRAQHLLALAEPHREPDQLARDRRSRPRGRDGRPNAAAGRPAPAHRPLPRGARPVVARGHAGPRPAVPLSPRPERPPPPERRLGGVRQHGRRLHALLPGGEGRGHAGALARGPAGPRRVAAPGRRGLLDARRLPQLGHRLRPAALAPDPQVGARPAGAGRHRGRGRARAGGAPAPGGVAPGPLLRLLPAPGRAGAGGLHAQHALRAAVLPARRQHPGARRRAGRGQRRPARSTRGSAGSRPRSRPPSTRSIPTRGASRSARPRTTPPWCRSARERSATAAWSSRGCSTPSRSRRRRSGAGRRRASGSASRSASGRRVLVTQAPRRRLGGGRCGSRGRRPGSASPAPRGARPTPARSRTSAPTGWSARPRSGQASRTGSPPATSRRDGRCAVAGGVCRSPSTCCSPAAACAPRCGRSAGTGRCAPWGAAAPAPAGRLPPRAQPDRRLVVVPGEGASDRARLGHRARPLRAGSRADARGRAGAPRPPRARLAGRPAGTGAAWRRPAGDGAADRGRRARGGVIPA